MTSRHLHPGKIARPHSFKGGDQTLLSSYYETVLSREITTVDEGMNGFRNILIKIALSDSSTSSRAVLQRILAISAYHLSRGNAGVQHNFAAVNGLSKRLQSSSEVPSRFSQLAASMLLITYGIFDISEST